MQEREKKPTYPHKSRRAKVDYICHIGGYGGNRHADTFPVSFTVAAYGADLSFENLWNEHAPDKWREGGGGTEEERKAYRELASRLHAKAADALFYEGVSNAQDVVKSTDVYSVTAEGEHVDVSFSFQGRSGKHLVVEQFEDIMLAGMSQELLECFLLEQVCDTDDQVISGETLRSGYSWRVPTSQLDRLYRYLRECATHFTCERAARLVEYEAASWLFCSIVDNEWDEELARVQMHNRMVATARTIREYLMSRGEGEALHTMLAILAEGAGVSKEELLDEA